VWGWFFLLHWRATWLVRLGLWCCCRWVIALSRDCCTCIHSRPHIILNHVPSLHCLQASAPHSTL
jgi:hypothetical protein